MSETVLLQMRSAYKSFPGVKTLQGVDLEPRVDKIYVLLDENGADKPTLIKVLGGIYIIEEGEIFINGQKATVDGIDASHNNEISTIHQGLVLVPHMAVAENTLLGGEPSKGLRVGHKTVEEETQQLLDTYHMSTDVGTLVKDPTAAQQQMVEIVKAIPYHSRILVMGEPTSSMSDKEVELLLSTMRELTREGVRIIYISHKMDELGQICDRVIVLKDGIYVGTEQVKDTTRDHLITTVVDRELIKYYTRDYMESGRVVLKCENIAGREMIRGASFEPRGGEIIGFAGLVGAGRSKAMRCIFGLTLGYTGEVSAGEKKTAIKSPINAIESGIALVFEDRKQEGLYKAQSVRFNPTVEVLKSFIRDIWVDADREEEITWQYIKMMDIKTPPQEQLIGNLSGDNWQEVIIGKWLVTIPKILIPDEPIRGVDVGTRSGIYGIIDELAKKGVSIIMISSELPEILNMSDQAYVMCDDRMTGCFSHEGYVTQEQIMELVAK